MESRQNGRGNSRDPHHAANSANDNNTNSKKKSQPALTNFFKKSTDGGKQSNDAHSSKQSNNDNNNALLLDNQATTTHVQTRQSAQLSQQNRESSQGNKQQQHQQSNSLLQTPKKKIVPETPGKKRVVPAADPSKEELNQIQSLIDQQVGRQLNSQMYQTQSQPGLEDSELKRSLRPRKQQNYKQMLEGDEATLKTIQDEQQEIKRKKREASNRFEDDDMLMDGEADAAQIERASDDEDDEDYPLEARRSARKRTKRQVNDGDEDEEEVEADQEEESSGEDEDPNLIDDDLDNDSYTAEAGNKRKLKIKAKKQASERKKNKVGAVNSSSKAVEIDDAPEEETVFIDNLPNDEFEIRRMLKEVKRHIKLLEKQFFEEEDSEKEEELKQINNNSKHDEKLEVFKETSHLKQFWCIPLSVNVMQLEYDKLAAAQMKQGGRLFDVITIDPPWQLSSANPTRGVAIAYDTLNDKEILNMPFEKLQTDGFLFIWVINAKYRFALEMMEKFGYKLVDEIAWVKQTVNGKIAKGHGYYLQHAKETCLVGVKGNVKGKARFNIESDVIFSQRRGQSQKPEEIYEIAEALVPNGYYLEIFGRRNNLHNGWVTIGNEL